MISDLFDQREQLAMWMLGKALCAELQGLGSEASAYAAAANNVDAELRRECGL